MGNKINLDSPTQSLSRNRCCQCAYEWQDQPFGLAKYHVCPRCDSAYWKWLNYDDDD